MIRKRYRKMHFRFDFVTLIELYALFFHTQFEFDLNSAFDSIRIYEPAVSSAGRLEAFWKFNVSALLQLREVIDSTDFDKTYNHRKTIKLGSFQSCSAQI